MHKLPDMGLCICYRYMLSYDHNLNSLHILDDSQSTDLLGNQANRYIVLWNIEHLTRMATDYKDHLGLKSNINNCSVVDFNLLLLMIFYYSIHLLIYWPLGGIGLHCVNAFPVNPSTHEHIATCLITWQLASIPQEPGQGSLHFWFIHAKLLEQSSLMVHSGLQLGGLPSNSGRHEHDGMSWMFLHIAFNPQGEGIHGSLTGDGNGTEI